MQKRVIMVVTFFINGLFSLCGQEVIRTVKAGEAVPDMLIKNILNYKTKESLISDFKGKLLILDFWNKDCASCISGFSKMEALQDQFAGKIQVILVTKDTGKDLRLLFKQSANLRNTGLPLVIGDSVLSELFPYRGVPHHVWIDANGIAQAAGFGYTNHENIQAFLSGKLISLPYRLPYQDFDARKSLLMEGNGRQLRNLRYYSFFMGRLDGTEKGSMGRNILSDTLNGKPISGIQTLNLSILQHIEKAFRFSVSSSLDNHLILKVKDPLAYLWPKRGDVNVDEWKSENLYSYGLFMPNASDEELRGIMQEDLQRYFRIKITFEKRKMKSRVLIRTTNDDRIKTTYSDSFEEFSKDGFVLRRQQFGTFFWFLKDANTDFSDPTTLPFVNGTGFSPTKLIDLDLKAKINDFHAMRKELQKYGLDIIEKESEVNVMIIKENNKHD